MKVENIDNRKLATIGAATTLATAGVSATVGYNHSLFNKNGEACDEFVEAIIDEMKNEDNKTFNRISNALKKFPEEKSLEQIAEQLKQENCPIADITKIIKEDKKQVRNGLKQIMIENFDLLDIPQKEGQTIEESVSKFMKFKNNAQLSENILETFDSHINMLKNSNYTAGAKEYIKLTYDTSKKEFKPATEEVPKTAIDFIKNTMTKIKKANAVKYGLAGGLAAAIATIGAMVTINACANKK